MLRIKGLTVRPDFWVLCLAAAIIGSPELLALSCLAAAMHEAGHILALRRFGATVRGVRLTALGAEITVDGLERISYGRELAATMAGVAVNVASAFLFGLLAARFDAQGLYLFAGLHAVLGLFNLLPILPLDGGRALGLLVAYFFGPMVGDAVSVLTGLSFALLLVPLGFYATFVLRGGCLFLLASLGLLWELRAQVGLAKGAVRV